MKFKKKNLKILLFLRENDPFSKKIKVIAEGLFSKCSSIVSNHSELSKDNLKLVKKWSGDYIICFRSKIILTKKILSKAKIAAINFHPGPPEFRGMGGLNFALFNNVKKYGCTAHIMDEKIDHGPIINTLYFNIGKKNNLADVLKKTQKKSFDQCKKILSGLVNEKNYLKKNLKDNEKKEWSDHLFTKKKLNKFYFVDTKISKDTFLKKLRASNINNFHLYTKIHNKIFKLYNKDYKDLNSNKNLYIYGYGSHLNSVIETAKESGNDISGIIMEKKFNNKKVNLDFPIYNKKQLSKMKRKNINLIIGIGDNKIRSKIYKFYKNKSFKFATLIHPSAIISKKAIIKSGSIINANVIINRNVLIGENTIINNDCLIEHDVKIGKNCHIAPSVKISGSVKISEGTFIGLGSLIKDKINIGTKVIVGVGSIIVKNLKSYKTYIGNSKELI